MATALDRHIEAKPEIRGGRPRIAGTRITVDDVVVMHLRLGHSIKAIAGKYDLPLAAVYAALAYYHDNREAVDARIEADEAYTDAVRRDNPSRLQARLSALNGG